MPAFSKGTRSKGVHRQFNSAAQAGNVQKSKKARKDAYLTKEAFMKEALARHMAVAEAQVRVALVPLLLLALCRALRLKQRLLAELLPSLVKPAILKVD